MCAVIRITVNSRAAVHAGQVSFLGQLCHTLSDGAIFILLAREYLLECVLSRFRKCK